MARLYDEMILLQQVVAPLIGIHQKSQEVVKLLKVANREVDQLQEWVAKYLDASQHLERKDMIFAEIEKVQLRFHHWNYMYVGEQWISTIVAYYWLHNGFESLAQKHGIPSIRMLKQSEVHK